MANDELLQLGKCMLRPCREESIHGPIFLSYRESDSASATTLLEQHLKRQFGNDQVFKYDSSIERGEHYWDEIRNIMPKCSSVLVVIGPRWLDARDSKTGLRRLENPRDAVRQEIEMAFGLYPGVRVIPVLVDGANMPSSDELPASIDQLAYRVAHDLPPKFFDMAVQDLITRLESPPVRTFVRWADVKSFDPRWALVSNAALRPVWSNVLVPFLVLLAGLTIRDARWLVPIAVGLWIALATVSLFDKQQAGCVQRCLHDPAFVDEHAE